MKFQRIGIAAIGAVTLTAATLTLTLNSNAQNETQGGPPAAAGPRNFPGGIQGGPQGQPGQPFPGQMPGQGRPNPMGGMGGGTAMDSDNSFLYVLQGNVLFKVAKADLRVVGAAPLMPPGAGQDRMVWPGGRGEGQGIPPRPPNQE